MRSFLFHALARPSPARFPSTVLLARYPSLSRLDNKFKLIKADSSWKLPRYVGGRSMRRMKSQHKNNFILIKCSWMREYRGCPAKKQPASITRAVSNNLDPLFNRVFVIFLIVAQGARPPWTHLGKMLSTGWTRLRIFRSRSSSPGLDLGEFSTSVKRNWSSCFIRRFH